MKKASTMTLDFVPPVASAAVVTLALLAGAGDARAQIVNIDAQVSGCDFADCHGDHIPPGRVVASLIAPVQLTLGPGTYEISNAAGLAGANPAFMAWRFDPGPQWTWSFMVADDATRTLLVQACCEPAVYSTQQAAAAQPFATGYRSLLTLARTTTLDFFVEDYFLPDNAGGVALKVSAVPEPASWALMWGGLLAVGYIHRRSTRP